MFAWIGTNITKSINDKPQPQPKAHRQLNP